MLQEISVLEPVFFCLSLGLPGLQLVEISFF